MAKERQQKQLTLEAGTAAYRIMQVLMLSGGEMSYDALGCMPYKSVTKSKAIERLVGEGVIEVKTTKGIKKIKLKMFDKNRSRYDYLLWDGAEDYPIDDLHQANVLEVRRKHSLAELYMLLMDTGAKITPDALNNAGKYAAKNRGIPEGSDLLPIFIPSKKCKSIFNYNLTTGDINREQKTNARYTGALLSDSGCYIVYNIRGGLLEWGTDGEKGGAEMSEDIRKVILGEWPETYLKQRNALSTTDMRNRFIDNGAILYTKKYEDYIYCFNRAPKGTRRNKKMGAECFTGAVSMADNYRNVYALPANCDGTALTYIMLQKEWHYKLTGLFVKDANRKTDMERQFDDIDGKSDTGQGLICFVDCDIRRLSSMLGKINQTPEGYQIICYDFQEALLRQLIPSPKCDIISCTIEDVLEAL